MGSIPLPALHVDPPQQNNALAMLAQLQQLKNAQTQNQMQQVQVQQQQMALKDQQTLRQLFIKHQGNLDQVIADAPQAGVSPQTIQGLQLNNIDVKTKTADLVTKTGAIAQQQADLMQGAHDAVDKASPDQKPAIYQQQLQALSQRGVDTSQMPQQYPGDDQFKFLGAIVKGHKQQVDEAMKEREVTAQEQTAQGRLLQGQAAQQKLAPMAPNEIGFRNQQFQDRYQVLNPGQKLPQEFALPQNANRQDYEDRDKALEQVEKAAATKAQQGTNEAIRQQTLSMSQDKSDRKPVVGTDPKTGEQVLVGSGDAKNMGLTGVMDADADMVNKATAARHWLQLATKTAPDNAPPEQKGIMQLINKMDSEGKLGPLAGRWNDFLAGKWGSGDPEYAALRNKMGLGTTKLMQAHVGSRGGAAIMEHFEDLANAGKMDGPTLKTSMASEVNYMKDVAMLPQSQQATKLATQGSGGGHIIQIGNDKYQYKGSGNTADLSNYTKLP